MRHSLSLILLLLLTACGTSPSFVDGDTSGKSRPPEEIYADAMKEMADENYETSAKLLQSLLSRYPYGLYAQQAQMEMAYAYYKQGGEDSPVLALAATDNFIKQFPTSPHLDYIYYLRGIINFNYDISIISAWFPRDLADHDMQNVSDSFDAFREVVTRFPNSIYAADARVRMQFLANTLAKHELKIAHYYLRRGAYVAAASRARGVLENYQQTTENLDALNVLVQAYNAMGMTRLRDDAQRVYDLNSRSGVAPAAPQAASAPVAATSPGPAAPPPKPAKS